jgi:outer membrane protein
MFARKRMLALFLVPAACLAQSSVTDRPPIRLTVADRTPIRLTLKRAVEIAISPEGNTQIQLAGELVKQAESRSLEARGALLPSIEATVSEQSLTRNLAAAGLQFNSPIPGIQFPTFVGPFNVFDARATVNQSVFDFSSIRRYQASRSGVRSSKADRDAADDQIASQVAKAYLAALRSEAQLEAVRADVELADAVLKQAENLKAAGTGTGIEITRARVQLSNDKQRQVVAENDRRAARLQLLRAMNMRLDTPIELDDKLSYVPVDTERIEKAQSEAMQLRADLRAQQERERNASLSASATKMERLPSLAAFGDYGSSGGSLNNSVPTRTYGLSLRVPLYDGGKRDARRAESASQLRSEEIRTRDLREQIELDVQLALDSLRSAEDQVKVAKEGLSLSENELEQARRRYAAGVANGLEVTDAQTRLARARDNQIAALFNHNQARIDLGHATGAIRRMLE